MTRDICSLPHQSRKSVFEDLSHVSSCPHASGESLDSTGHSVVSADYKPFYSMLRQLPRESLTDRSRESQTFRESLLRGSRILFVCAGSQTKKFIYEVAQSKGVSIVMIDNPDSWSADLKSAGVFDYFLPVDMSQNSDQIFESAMKAIEQLAPHWSPDGICTFVELAVELTSRLGKAFGLVHADIDSVTAVRDKSKTRAILQGVKSRRVNSEEQLVDALKHIGYPAVIKPVSGAASLCVQRFDTLDEAISLFHKTMKDFTSSLVVSSGALARRSQTVGSEEEPADTSISAHSVITTDIMIEEYLDGPEVDVDIILSDGECQYANVIDNGPTFEPYFAETWAAIPSLMEPPSRVLELRDMAVASLKRLGLTDGVFHVELKYTPRGPRLIEVNARMGGGPTQTIHKLVYGVDLVVEQLMIAVGIPSRPPVPSSPLTRVGYAFINARKTGYVESVEFLNKYKSRPFVVHIIPFIEPLEICYGPNDGLPSWLGEIVVAHPDGPTALRIVQEIEQEIADEFSSLCVPVCL